ncbi:DUF2884 domain-containing protein [Sodalis ligni]|jgi:hypothetical protein|uniref:DUF2884 family protein n=1 Tax=Sodalis ligni TaxID=2697027 RepID=A0A4R1NB21_9GAMM|nr:DUF2884 domain-containing protein [Sodalis ligni]QWA11978.1 DUF2884 domain-containing protein [Sodalis ligni]TCL04624.1 DUF2884 family protein [Sodalis ligni]
MLRKLVLGLLMLTAWQAQADYQCPVKPQDDIFISSQQVRVAGASGDITITPDGQVARNGQPLNLNGEQRRQAADYQASVREQLPWIDEGARSRLEKGRIALDRIIVQQLGSDSHVRERLTTLDRQLKQQMNRIIEHRPEGLAFHHQAIAQVEQDGRRIVQDSMGGVVQDSLNEMGTQQAMKAATGSSPLQAVMGNLGSLQQAIQNEWNSQEQDFQQFGHQVCQRVTHLEQQRGDLMKSLQ